MGGGGGSRRRRRPRGRARRGVQRLVVALVAGRVVDEAPRHPRGGPAKAVVNLATRSPAAVAISAAVELTAALPPGGPRDRRERRAPRAPAYRPRRRRCVRVYRPEIFSITRRTRGTTPARGVLTRKSAPFSARAVTPANCPANRRYKRGSDPRGSDFILEHVRVYSGSNYELPPKFENHGICSYGDEQFQTS